MRIHSLPSSQEWMKCIFIPFCRCLQRDLFPSQSSTFFSFFFFPSQYLHRHGFLSSSRSYISPERSRGSLHEFLPSLARARMPMRRTEERKRNDDGEIKTNTRNFKLKVETRMNVDRFAAALHPLRGRSFRHVGNTETFIVSHHLIICRELRKK
jgi:hypothetical protein